MTKKPNNVVSISRQQRRKQTRDKSKENEKVQKAMGLPIKRGEVMNLMNLISTQLSEFGKRLAQTELMVAGLYELVSVKELASEEEVTKAVEKQRQRSMVYKEILETKKNYPDRLKKCLDWGISFKATPLFDEIKMDEDLSDADREKISKDFDISLHLIKKE